MISQSLFSTLSIAKCIIFGCMAKEKNIIISNYPNKLAKANIGISLSEELLRIKNGLFKAQIERSRDFLSQGLVAEYKEAKSMLPVVTFSGLFNGAHKAENIIEYTGLIVIDFDGLETVNLPNKKRELFSDKFILAVWISPSNKGLKTLIKTDATIDTHKIYFEEACDYLASKYGVDADKSGSDICRLCFSSYDPEVLTKQDCESFSVNVESLKANLLSSKIEKSTTTKLTDSFLEKKLFYATEGKNSKRDRDTIDKIIKYLKKRHLSITGSYHDWYRVALSIANTFTYDLGKKYYLYLCQLDGVAHDEYKSINLLEYCYRNRKFKEINFATIIYLAEQKGFVNSTKR